MTLTIHAASHPGKVRDHNEDMVLVGNIVFRDDIVHTSVVLKPGEPFLAAVADGMGGHQAGETASRLAAGEIARRVNGFDFSRPGLDLAQVFSTWIGEIHAAIVQDGVRNPERTGMGTTLVGLFALDGKFHLINAGDSRLYRFGKGTLSRLSRDHSLRELSGLPMVPANILANSLGGGEEAFADFDEILPPPVPGDLFLLCSDGLTDMLSDADIRDVLRKNGADAVGKLVEKANGNGGADNISVVTILVE